MIVMGEVERLYNHFHSLGMPREITLESFKRIFDINTGHELRVTFRLLAKRLAGRQEVSKARACIARFVHLHT